MTKVKKNSSNSRDWKGFFKMLLSVCIVFCCVVLTGFLSVVFYQWYNSTGEFNLKKVEVVDNYLLNKQEIIAVSGLKKGCRILDVDLEALRLKLNKSTYIADCKVSLVLPATIQIVVQEEQPIAYLLKNGKLKYISDASRVIGDVKPESSYNLPLINGKFSSRLIAFLGQAKELSPFVYHQISEISEENRGVRFLLTKNSVPVIVGREDFAEKILVVENFLREEGSKINFTDLEYVDLRFDKQVVVKEINSEVAEVPTVNVNPAQPLMPVQVH